MDVGAVDTKAVILRGAELLAFSIRPTGAGAAADCLRAALRRAGVAAGDLRATASTGYGRDGVPFPAAPLAETACHARAASHFFPGTATVIDIGGQDVNIISVRAGAAADFVTNDRCAAGTGRFLEIMAGALKIPLSAMGRESLRARREGGGSIRISGVCAIFAESEVISLLSQRRPRGEILLALHEAVAERIAGMAGGIPIGPEAVLTGGVAKNAGVADCVARRLGIRVDIPPEPRITGALGAALLAGAPPGAVTGR